MDEKEKTPFFETKLGKILKVVWEIIYYGVIYLVGISILYSSYNEIQVSQGILTTAFLAMLYYHKSTESHYKYWESMIDSDFYYNFTKNYKPPILLPQLILLFVIAKYCSNGAFILCFLAMFTYDLWDRRYVTHDIKHDMILQELKKFNKF